LWSSLPTTTNRERGPNSGESIMRKLITTIALLALVGTSVAIAQRAGSSTNPADVPVGHRQPRADQVPSEKGLMDPSGIIVLKGLTLPPRE
jgi:propanediol dehydratase small subunit